MSFLPIILSALVPVVFVILLGVLAGRTGLIKPSSNGILAVLALDFCLPLLLFSATAAMSLDQLADWRFFVGTAIGLLSVYVVALVLSLTVFGKPIAASSLQALNGAFPNMAFIGVPVLTAAVGTSAVLSVVIGNLISSFVLLPLTLTLLEAGCPGEGRRKGAGVVWHALGSAVVKPLVWAPLLGVAMALLQVPLPGVAQKSLALIGEATSGVALMALGLLLSGQKLRIGWAAAVNVVFKNLAQPVVMGLLAVALGVTGVHRREMILLGALPTASMTAMFAVQYGVYTEESDATILLSTVLSIVTLGVAIALTAG
jgi:predicted permease